MDDSPHNLRSLGETRSGPVAFLGLIVDMSLRIMGQCKIKSEHVGEIL